jgi:K(+)-stimulated pyrophosphate-energized sodium pump
MNEIFLIAALAGVAALCAAVFLARWIGKNEEGNDRMREIASYIRSGAMAFLMREYRTIGLFALVMFVVLIFAVNIPTAILFLCGAAFSLAAGLFGMRTATSANVRTAAAARLGMPPALRIAFRGGAVMGLSVVGLGVLGIGVILYLFGVESQQQIEYITGFGLGATSMSLFGRVGGGIFTKAADMGADLVGKVEAGIPEDDPRNPAVIADNVGDNVGDVAGMGADLFDSYVGAIISAVVLAITVKGAGGESLIFQGVAYPVLIATIGVLTSTVAVFFVGGKNTKKPAAALNGATYIGSAVVLLAALALSFVIFGTDMRFHGFAFGGDTANYFGGIGAFGAVASGLVIGSAIGFFTERATSSDYKSVRRLAKQTKTGAATTIIDGFSVGLLSAVWPLVLIAAGILLAYFCAGIYGIGLAAVGMLSTAGLVVAVDAYGPVADNAGGIAEMAGLPEETRAITDKLDSVGNTTAAIGKGFAIGASALTVLGLFVSYTEIAGLSSIDLLNPLVVAGLFLGGVMPALFSALTMRSVGRAASDMIEEVRRQFREDKGIMEGTSKPDYGKCIRISTDAALREMIIPGLLVVVCPIVVGLIDTAMLGGMLAGAMLVGVLLGITMANAGGAWDNAKKYIEEGNHGGKGSEAHKAAVVGDTVGDPFKDTSGPSMNTLICLMTIVSVVFLPLFLR